MLTTKQAATELGIQPGSVKKLCQRGILKAERIGRDWLISRDEIERYKAERKPVGRPKTMKTFRYEETHTLTANDLSKAMSAHGGTAYRITIYDSTGTRAHAETAEALSVDGRLGIAWGADATWADVKDVQSGIEMWLNDGEAWAAAN
jgi:excisionase family DNA binding protein